MGTRIGTCESKDIQQDTSITSLGNRITALENAPAPEAGGKWANVPITGDASISLAVGDIYKIVFKLAIDGLSASSWEQSTPGIALTNSNDRSQTAIITVENIDGLQNLYIPISVENKNKDIRILTIDSIDFKKLVDPSATGNIIYISGMAFNQAYNRTFSDYLVKSDLSRYIHKIDRWIQ